MAAVGFFFAVLLTSILKSSNLGALAEVAKIKFECQDGQGPICAVDFVDHGIYYLSQKNQDIERVTFDRLTDSSLDVTKVPNVTVLEVRFPEDIHDPCTLIVDIHYHAIRVYLGSDSAISCIQKSESTPNQTQSPTITATRSAVTSTQTQSPTTMTPAKSTGTVTQPSTQPAAPRLRVTTATMGSVIAILLLMVGVGCVMWKRQRRHRHHLPLTPLSTTSSSSIPMTGFSRSPPTPSPTQPFSPPSPQPSSPISISSSEPAILHLSDDEPVSARTRSQT